MSQRHGYGNDPFTQSGAQLPAVALSLTSVACTDDRIHTIRMQPPAVALRLINITLLAVYIRAASFDRSPAFPHLTSSIMFCVELREASILVLFLCNSHQAHHKTQDKCSGIYPLLIHDGRLKTFHGACTDAYPLGRESQECKY